MSGKCKGKGFHAPGRREHGDHPKMTTSKAVKNDPSGPSKPVKADVTAKGKSGV